MVSELRSWVLWCREGKEKKNGNKLHFHPSFSLMWPSFSCFVGCHNEDNILFSTRASSYMHFICKRCNLKCHSPPAWLLWRNTNLWGDAFILPSNEKMPNWMVIRLCMNSWTLQWSFPVYWLLLPCFRIQYINNMPLLVPDKISKLKIRTL